jgi:FkbM family methyltransferase
MSKIDFITGKIKRYGFFGIFAHIYKKYSAVFFHNTFLRNYLKVKGREYKIYFSKTNVAKALYLFPNLHDGDVDELYDILEQKNLQEDKIKGELIFVDLGANIGTITLPIAKYLYNHGVVYSIEAHPKTFFELQKNIDLNKLQNIQTWNIAVGMMNGTVKFTNKKNDDANNITEQGDIHVPCLTLDTLFKDFERIDVLKIDVEGYEKFVLENGITTLKKTKYIYMEYLEETSARFGYKREYLKEFLEENGFECTLSNPEKHQNPDIDNLICKNLNYK